VRSGIARVARCMARAFASSEEAGAFDLTFAGPLDRLRDVGADRWGRRPARLVPWDSGRLSLTANFTWPGVRRNVGSAIWYFPHWDVPWLAAPRRSVVLVSDVIPIVVPGATTPLRRELAKRWIRYSAASATRAVVSTEFTKGEVIDLWPDLADRISVIPLGVDPVFFGSPAPLPGDLQRLAESAPFMLSVGNRKAHKNLAIGPEVLARVPGINWVVVGEAFRGWDAVMMRATALGVRHRIHVLEPRPDEEIHSLYAAASCLLFPSRAEGFGLPVLEALASGTRVVAGAAGATREILSGHGAVCDPDDPDAFAAAVSAAVAAGPPADEGRRHAALFTWDRAAARLRETIRSIG
jgi:glycosyltransferase involved in cell wall biosynthesis